jgi:hypothetical protein
MADSYDLIFLGINPEIPNREAAVGGIAELLEIDAQHLEYLLSNKVSGAVKLAIPKDAVRHYQAGVARLGGICNYRPSAGRGSQFELAPIEVRKEEFVFSCPACEYKETVESEEDVPSQCPECGVIPSKYDKVASFKQEREKIKKRLLSAQKIREQQAQESAGFQELGSWRQQMEDDVRQEIGLPKAARPPLAGSAALLWLLLGVAIGGVGASAYYEAKLPAEGQRPRQDRPQPFAPPANRP